MKNRHSISEKDVFYWLQNGEGQQLDYKHAITNAQKIAKTIVAFANSRGGKLLIGIDDNKDLVGVNEEQEKFLLEEAATKYCIPKMKLNYFSLNINGRKILVAEIEESFKKPIFWLGKNNKKVIYVRSKDKTTVANELLKEHLIKGALNNPIVNKNHYFKIIESVRLQFKNQTSFSTESYAAKNNITENQATIRLLNFVLEGVLTIENNKFKIL